MANALGRMPSVPVHVGLYPQVDMQVYPWPYAEGLTSSRSLVMPPSPILAQPTIYVPSVVPAVYGGHYFFGFYFHVYVEPDLQVLRNPRLNVGNPIHVWNASPYPNTLLEVDQGGLPGVEWDQELPTVFYENEYREVQFTLTNASPLEIDQDILFVFEQNGVGKFHLSVTRAVVISVEPLSGMEETWSWLTEVFVTNDGTEQRVGLRPGPRVELKYEASLEGAAAWRTQFSRLMVDALGSVVVPFWQYNSRLSAPAYLGASTVAFDTVRANLRADEYAIIRGRRAQQLVKVTAVTDGGITIDGTLDYDFEAGALVCPALECLLGERPGLDMYRVDAGVASVTARTLLRRPSLVRPGAVAGPSTFDGYLVLDRRHLNDDTVSYAFDGGMDVVDYQTGMIEPYSTWKHTQVEGSRTYLVQRMIRPEEMDWWRSFLEQVNGRRVAFLAPTWRPDLTLAETPAPNSAELKLTGSEYSSNYFKHNTFKRLMLQTNLGNLYVKATSATQDTITGIDTVTLTTGLPSGLTRVDSVSFLNVVRLASDEVRLVHHALKTTLELSLRSTDG